MLNPQHFLDMSVVLKVLFTFFLLQLGYCSILCTQCLKNTVQNCFCQNFAKFPPILIFFWQKDGKEAEIMLGALIFHLTTLPC